MVSSQKLLPDMAQDSSNVSIPNVCERSQWYKTQYDALRKISKYLYDFWESGDGLPKAEKHIIKQIQTELLPTYSEYRKGRGRVRGKKQKKYINSDTQLKPKRRSLRLGVCLSTEGSPTKIMKLPLSPKGISSEVEAAKAH